MPPLWHPRYKQWTWPVFFSYYKTIELLYKYMKSGCQAQPRTSSLTSSRECVKWFTSGFLWKQMWPKFFLIQLSACWRSSVSHLGLMSGGVHHLLHWLFWNDLICYRKVEKPQWKSHKYTHETQPSYFIYKGISMHAWMQFDYYPIINSLFN